MSLKETLENERAKSVSGGRGKVNGKNCRLCHLIETDALPADEVEYLQESMLDPEFSAQAIYRSLRMEGYVIGEHTVYRHKNAVVAGKQCI